jgi:hypothetical protein
LIYSHDNVVIGGELSALLYAYVNGYPLFFTTPVYPFRFDYFESTVDLRCVGIPSIAQVLKTPSGFKEVGIPKYLLWERLFFLLSLRGLLPLAGFCGKMRYDGDKVVCTNEYSKIYEFSFDTCYYFRDANISGLAQSRIDTAGDYICYDQIAFNRGGKHEIDYISTDDDFVGEIWFHSSDRIDGNTGVKDACIVSRLKHSQITDPNYSETMARFKMESVLKEHGMKGPFNGYGPNGRPKHYKIRTSHIKRVQAPPPIMPWEESGNIKKTNLDNQQMIEMLSRETLGQYEKLKCDYILPA